jgi:hypothetical protein
MTAGSPRPRSEGARRWKIAGLALAALGLAGAALDVSDWLRFKSGGGGLLALFGGLFFAFSTVVILRLSVSALMHSWSGDPEPKSWYEVLGKHHRGEAP